MRIRKIVCMVLFLSQVVLLNSSFASGKISFICDWQDIGGDDKYVNELDINIQANDSIALGLLANANLESDYTKIKPYISWQAGKQISLTTALSTDSGGADLLYLGVSGSLNLGEKISLALAPQYVFGLSEADDFLDIFASLNYQISEATSLGLEFVYDYWPDSGEDFVLFGPALSYQLNKTWKIYSRVSVEEGDDGSAVGLKLGLTMKF